MDAFHGHLLRARRDAKALSRDQLAKEARCHYGTIVKFERDEIQPSIDMLCRLADALDCGVNEFFGPAHEPDTRGTELGPEIDAWVRETLATAPPMTDEQARRVSAVLFGQAAS